MTKKIKNIDLTPTEVSIENKIHIIRGEKVMLDSDLAELYQVETKVLNQAVKRNIARFPENFLFKLDKSEESNLRSQIVTSSYGGRRFQVFAFTELGIAMLSSVLRSDRAVHINIQIMRTFTKLRKLLSSHEELKDKLLKLEKKYDGQFSFLFKTIHQLLIEEAKPKRKIGFKLD